METVGGHNAEINSSFNLNLSKFHHQIKTKKIYLFKKYEEVIMNEDNLSSPTNIIGNEYLTDIKVINFEAGEKLPKGYTIIQ